MANEFIGWHQSCGLCALCARLPNIDLLGIFIPAILSRQDCRRMLSYTRRPTAIEMLPISIPKSILYQYLVPFKMDRLPTLNGHAVSRPSLRCQALNVNRKQRHCFRAFNANRIESNRTAEWSYSHHVVTTWMMYKVFFSIHNQCRIYRIILDSSAYSSFLLSLPPSFLFTSRMSSKSCC